MKAIKNSGLIIFLIGLGIFTSLTVIGKFTLSQAHFDQVVVDNRIKSELFIDAIHTEVVGKEFDGMMALSPKVAEALENANTQHRKNKEYKKVIYTNPHDLAAIIGKKAGSGFIANNKGLMWFLTFGLGIIGALLWYIWKTPPTVGGSPGWFLYFWCRSTSSSILDRNTPLTGRIWWTPLVKASVVTRQAIGLFMGLCIAR
jgi:hypothetical protein